MSTFAPQGFYQWLAAVSVPVAGFAVKQALSLAPRLAVLEKMSQQNETKVSEIDVQQRRDGEKLAVHSELLSQVQSQLASISSKLESLPRIATILEQLIPKFDKVVPREEIDTRFASIQQQLNEIKHLD